MFKIAISGALCLAVAAAAWFLVQPYLPGTADLETVRKDATQRVEELLAVRGLAPGAPIFIRIFKEERQLELWVRNRSDGRYKKFRTWPVVAMSGKLGPKLAEGDLQAPE